MSASHLLPGERTVGAMGESDQRGGEVEAEAGGKWEEHGNGRSMENGRSICQTEADVSQKQLCSGEGLTPGARVLQV